MYLCISQENVRVLQRVEIASIKDAPLYPYQTFMTLRLKEKSELLIPCNHSQNLESIDRGIYLVPFGVCIFQRHSSDSLSSEQQTASFET